MAITISRWWLKNIPFGIKEIPDGETSGTPSFYIKIFCVRRWRCSLKNQMPGRARRTDVKGDAPFI